MWCRQLLIGLLAVPLANEAAAQAVAGNDMCFTTTGKVQFASRNAPPVAGATNVGGIIKVNGITHVIPDNTECTLPAQTATWNDLFQIPRNMAPAEKFFPKYVTTVSATGVVTQTPSPNDPDLYGFEATLIGNIQYPVAGGTPPLGAALGTGPRYIVGLCYLTPTSSLVNSCGYINSIDADGTMNIGLTQEAITGQKVRLNDPNGCYGPRTSRIGAVNGVGGTLAAGIAKASDPLWGVDCDNPSIRAQTGFPHCTPHTADSGWCSAGTLAAANRPAAGLSDVPNPALFSALVPGDYVCYAGVNVEYDVSTAADDVVWIWGLQSDLRLTTPPGSTCSYIMIEELLNGLGGNIGTSNAATGVNTGTTPNPPLLGVTRVQTPTNTNANAFSSALTPWTHAGKLLGVVTEATNCQVNIYHDLACATNPWGKVANALGVQQVLPIGRWLWDDIGLYDEYFLPGSRNWKVELTGPNCAAAGTDPLGRSLIKPEIVPVTLFNQNNACARYNGRFSAPVAEYVFPEPPQFGSPVNACNFGDLPHLVADPVKPALSPLPNKSPPMYVATPDRLCGTPVPIANKGASCFPDTFVPQGVNQGTFAQRNNAYKYVHVNAMMGKATGACFSAACQGNGTCTAANTACCVPNALGTNCPGINFLGTCSNNAGVDPTCTAASPCNTCSNAVCTTTVRADFFQNTKGTSSLLGSIVLTRLGVTNQWTGTFTYTIATKPDTTVLTATGCCTQTQTAFRV